MKKSKEDSLGKKVGMRIAKNLRRYLSKRDLKSSREPSARLGKKKEKLQFVIQKHAARRLHYDLRLEMDGVLKSWAVPKGPSEKVGERRLAIMVEDYPYEYKNFEWVIPEGYGAGRKGELLNYDQRA